MGGNALGFQHLHMYLVNINALKNNVCLLLLHKSTIYLPKLKKGIALYFVAISQPMGWMFSLLYMFLEPVYLRC